jgi:predicted  nucleic acid-binding Zn-ribbon protein
MAKLESMAAIKARHLRIEKKIDAQISTNNQKIRELHTQLNVNDDDLVYISKANEIERLTFENYKLEHSRFDDLYDRNVKRSCSTHLNTKEFPNRVVLDRDK